MCTNTFLTKYNRNTHAYCTSHFCNYGQLVFKTTFLTTLTVLPPPSSGLDSFLGGVTLTIIPENYVLYYPICIEL